MSQAAPFLLFAGIAVVFWLLMIRPAQRKQREHQLLQASIAVGDEVMTTSGIFGKVRALEEETVQLAVSGDVEIRILRAAIGRVVTPATPAHDVRTELADPTAEPEEK